MTTNEVLFTNKNYHLQSTKYELKGDLRSTKAEVRAE